MGKVAGKILSQRKHRAKLLLTTFGFLLGLALLMIAVQTYLDLQKLMNQPGGGQQDYLIINKGVSGAHSLGGMNKDFRTGFSEQEVDFVKGQPFINDLGTFSNSTFDISSNLQDRLAMYAYLFFESVPDRFLDTIPPNWQWQEGDDRVPVLLNKEWLNVYNFNVSLMYGLPQLSEETVSNLDFEIVLEGNGRQEKFQASIVAFSHRLPAITVPQEFLSYANEKFGDGAPPPSRLILQVDDASSQNVVQFLKERNYQFNTEKTVPDGFKRIAQATFSISGLLGILFFIFAFGIVLTTLQLSVADVSEELRLLIDLGYEPGKLSGMLLKNVMGYLVAATLLAAAVFIGTHYTLLDYLRGNGFTIESASYLTAVLAGLLLLILVTSSLYASIAVAIKRVVRR